jgi:hypothetical protein
MRKAIFILFTAISVGTIVSSCSKDSGGGNNTFTVDCNTVTNKLFGAHVAPIIQSSCAISGCHAAGSTNGPGPLTSHPEIAAAASRIKTAVANGSMPKNSSLSSSQKSSIICWVDAGAQNN